MGTSQSSGGPAGGVSLVPPWVPDPSESPADASTGDPAEGDDQQDPAQGAATQPPPPKPSPIAPKARFRDARRSLGDWARSGGSARLRRGLGHYVQSGLGGASTAARRMGGTARNAGALYGALDSLRSGDAAAPEGIDPAALAGRPAREAIDFIAQAISPTDGTQDAEASRDSVCAALRELVTREPDVDLSALNEKQIEGVLARYIGHDIARRVELDVGTHLLNAAPTKADAMRRLGEMKDFIQQCVSSRFRARRTDSGPLSRAEATKLASNVIRDTYQVFEEYLK